MRKTRDASRIVRLIDRNVDAFWEYRKSHAAFSERNRVLWDRAYALGVDEAVMAVIGQRLP